MESVKNNSISIFMVFNKYSDGEIKCIPDYTDLNILIEVLEKIESLGYWIELCSGNDKRISIGRNGISDDICFSKEKELSKAIYDCVYKFCEIYNKQ